MNYSKNVIRLAREITSHYSTFDKLEDQYSIDINDVDEFSLNELAALIMQEDSILANEATGSDNPSYLKKMLPALTKMLSNPIDKDEQIEFVSIWTEGTTDYFRESIKELLDNQLMEKNSEIGKLFSLSARQYYNEARL